MKTIWKFELPEPTCQIYIAAGAQVVRVGRQGPAICLWAIVETENPSVPRMFKTIGTGQPIPHGAHYIGTWDDGPLVWHLFSDSR